MHTHTRTHTICPKLHILKWREMVLLRKCLKRKLYGWKKEIMVKSIFEKMDFSRHTTFV